ncbi:MAG: tetratricopeptide repeat protein [Candidatus Omnitrophota bacterium]
MKDINLICTNKKNKYSRAINLLIIGIFLLSISINTVFAQNQERLVFLTKQILESKPGSPDQELNKYLKEAAEQFIAENKFDDCVDYLKSLIKKNPEIEAAVDSYIAFVRYSQLKHLEESQDWNEYFNKGNDYRGQILESAQLAIDKTTSKDSVNINARMVIWRLFKDQDDALADSALSSLMDAIIEYSKDAKDIKPLKETGDLFLSYGDKAKSKELYKLYVNKLDMSEISDKELEEIAAGFYKEVNLDLAETAYDVYIERVINTMPEKEFVPILFRIAKQFSYAGQGPKDMVYAEKIFQKIKAAAKENVFDEDAFYLRAFNLVKIKEFNKAKEIYIDMLKSFPDSTYKNKVNYQLGVIYAYVLKDLDTALKYFEELSQQESIDAEVISSLYQLGLLNQWLNDLDKAADYYNKLRERAKDYYPEKVNQAEERLKEINQVKPIDYSLRMFLDTALGNNDKAFDMTKVDIYSSPYSLKKQESLNVTLVVHTAQTGCLQVEMEYLCSGDLGNNIPFNNVSEFDTSYKDAGLKEINLVVMSPSGIIDYSIDLVEVD